MLEQSYTFTGNQVYFYSQYGEERPESRAGYFTFTKKRITFIPGETEEWKKYSLNYAIGGNRLVLIEFVNERRRVETFTKE